MRKKNQVCQLTNIKRNARGELIEFSGGSTGNSALEAAELQLQQSAIHRRMHDLLKSEGREVEAARELRQAQVCMADAERWMDCGRSVARLQRHRILYA